MGAAWASPWDSAPFAALGERWPLARVAEIVAVFKESNFDFGADEFVISALLQGDRDSARQIFQLFAPPGGLVNIMSFLVALIAVAADDDDDSSLLFEAKLDLIFDAFDFSDLHALTKDELSILALSSLRALLLLAKEHEEHEIEPPTEAECEQITTTAYATLGGDGNKEHTARLTKPEFKRFVIETIGTECLSVEDLIRRFVPIDEEAAALALEEEEAAALALEADNAAAAAAASLIASSQTEEEEERRRVEDVEPPASSSPKRSPRALEEAIAYSRSEEEEEEEEEEEAVVQRPPTASDQMLCSLSVTVESTAYVCTLWPVDDGLLRVRCFERISSTTQTMHVASKDWAHLGYDSKVLKGPQLRDFASDVLHQLKLEDGRLVLPSTSNNLSTRKLSGLDLDALALAPFLALADDGSIIVTGSTSQLTSSAAPAPALEEEGSYYHADLSSAPAPAAAAFSSFESSFAAAAPAPAADFFAATLLTA